MSDAAAGLARFLHRIGALKRTPRTGWGDRGVPPQATESVADHTFRTAMLAWLAAAETPGLERDRVLKLALLHDLAEAITGDWPPYDPADLANLADDAARRAFLEHPREASPARKRAKQAAEAAAMADLLADLPTALADELGALWRELEARESAEARFVKEADRLETYLQAREYLAEHPSRPLAGIAGDTSGGIDSPAMAELRDAVAALVLAGAAPAAEDADVARVRSG